MLAPAGGPLSTTAIRHPSCTGGVGPQEPRHASRQSRRRPGRRKDTTSRATPARTAGSIAEKTADA